MSSTNRSSRPPGSISIPIEFVNEPKFNRTSTSFRRLQPRQNATAAYERLIRNSHFNQPLRDTFPRVYDPSPASLSRSNEDLLGSKMDTTRPNEHFRRSFDVLNNLSTGEQNFSMKTTKNSQSTNDLTNDQCDAQTDCSATHSSPSTSNQQQQQVDEHKNGADQQVPSNDVSSTQSEPDPNAIALEKLEQIRQNLNDFNDQVDAYAGSTRNDRLYKVLDEQAVKLMMRCDELVNVNSDIKDKRKEMIRNVQSSLAKLESKVPLTPSIEENRNSIETKATSSPPSSSTINQEQTPTNSVEKN